MDDGLKTEQKIISIKFPDLLSELKFARLADVYGRPVFCEVSRPRPSKPETWRRKKCWLRLQDRSFESDALDLINLLDGLQSNVLFPCVKVFIVLFCMLS